MRRAAQPDLYDAQAGSPVLSGTECAQCGHVYFPPLAIGCEVCGAAEGRLRPTRLAASGTIHSLARVHRHYGRPPAPFTVAEIRLDSGPLIRALLTPGSDAARIGDTVRAVWAAAGTDEDGTEIVEPAFTISDGATG